MKQTVQIRMATDTMIRHVIANMSDSDAQEIKATSYEHAWDHVLFRGSTNAQIKDCALLDGEPVAILGAVEIHPTVWRMFMYSTNRFPFVSLSVAKHAKKCIIPKLEIMGARRLEAYSVAWHKKAHKFMRFFGARVEAKLENYGTRGETFYIYAKHLKHVQHTEKRRSRDREAAGVSEAG